MTSVIATPWRAAVGSAACPRSCRSVSRSSPRRSSPRRPTCRGRPTPTAARRSPSSPGGPATRRGTSRTRPPPRTQGYLRHILEVGHLSVLEHASVTHVPHRGLPVAHARADPAPALLLQPALAAVRARAATPRSSSRRSSPRTRSCTSASSPPPRPPLAAYRELLDGLEKRVRRRPERHAAAQAGAAGGPRGPAHRHRDADRRHRQLPRLAALHRDAGQRARRRRDPRAGHRLPARAAAGRRATCSATSGSAPWPTARRSRRARRHRGLSGSVGAGPYPRDRGRAAADRHPVRGPPPAHPRAGDAEAGPHRHGTVSLFGERLRYDLSERFPLVTTKKVHFRSIAVELLWFLRGDSNVGWLREQRRHHLGRVGRRPRVSSGPVYGVQWRSWPTPDGEQIDQISHPARHAAHRPRLPPDDRLGLERRRAAGHGAGALPRVLPVLRGRRPALLPALPAQRRHVPRRAVQHRQLRAADPHGGRPGRPATRATSSGSAATATSTATTSRR